ncbi:MAG: hypothetical protein WC967_14405 [Balneolaceae bacterium]
MNINSLSNYKAEYAVRVLIHNISSIRNVLQWAEVINISQTWLIKIIQETYNFLPKEVLREVRYEQIVWLMQNDLDAICYSIARDAGFPSEAALRMFLTRHYATNFSKLRLQLLSDKLQIEWKWLEVE